MWHGEFRLQCHNKRVDDKDKVLWSSTPQIWCAKRSLNDENPGSPPCCVLALSANVGSLEIVIVVRGTCTCWWIIIILETLKWRRRWVQIYAVEVSLFLSSQKLRQQIKVLQEEGTRYKYFQCRHRYIITCLRTDEKATSHLVEAWSRSPSILLTEKLYLKLGEILIMKSTWSIRTIIGQFSCRHGNVGVW